MTRKAPSPEPGWLRLWRHSYRLGCRWLAGGWRHGWTGARVGVCRLAVPLDPWRYYEMGKVADQPFEGRCLDLASPKLLPSLLRYEGRGEWLGIDLFEKEIDRWRRVDPSLQMEVADATSLPYEDASFDHLVSISVLEHIAGDGDTAAMSEAWRVLRPGGSFHLTTNVARRSTDIWRQDRIYGEASALVDGRVFFERHYSPSEVDQRLLRKPWRIVEREYARQVDPRIEARFYRWTPWSYVYGGWLRRSCPDNFRTGPDPDVLPEKGHGVIYLRLEKPVP